MAEGPAASKVAPTDVHPAKPGIYGIPKDDITQSYVYFIGQGVKRDTPDYYAINAARAWPSARPRRR